MNQNRTIFADVVDDGPVAFQWFITTWNELVDNYNQIIPDITNIVKFATFSRTRILNVFKKYRGFNCLYDQETSRNMLLSEMENFIQVLINDAISVGLINNEYWTNFDKIGDISNVAMGKVNYTGFGITNQQGQYSSTENKTTSTGTPNKLQFMNYLQQFVSDKIFIFTERVKSVIFQLLSLGSLFSSFYGRSKKGRNPTNICNWKRILQ